MNIQNEIENATILGQRHEDLVVRQQNCPADQRNMLLLTCWSLVFDLDKGILCLLRNDLHGSAFALSRPIVEATIRAHLALSCTDENLKKILDDTYRVNYSTVGKEIDGFFKLHGLFDKFLRESTPLLHSFTHSGRAQLARRVDGTNITPRYAESEIGALIRVGSSAAFMATSLVTKHFKFEAEWQSAQQMFVEMAQ
jgi:hypothetical protein